jgi:hypothetical protein
MAGVDTHAASIEQRGGLVCGDEIDNGAPVSSECSVTTADPAAQCAGAGTCPVNAAYTLRCSGGGYGPWVVPWGTTGATVMFVTNTGRFVTRLFSLAPGAARVDDVPALTSAANALAVDPATGNRTIFAGEMPGVCRVRESASGWRRESAVEVDRSNLALVTDARVLDANRTLAERFLPVSPGARKPRPVPDGNPSLRSGEVTKMG